jgi:hypothetical protein
MPAPEAEQRPKSGLSGTATFLVSAVGLLAALLTALATANGGIDRIERNERWVLFAGVVCVLVAIATGALYTALSTPEGDAAGAGEGESPARADGDKQSPPRQSVTKKLIRRLRTRGLQLLLLTGVLVLATGLIVVAYSAVAHVAGRPGITATITYDKKLGIVLTGDVTVSDISASKHLEMRVDALTPNATNRLSHKAIYAASFGPNSSGDVDHTYQVIIPADTDQVLIQAWTGQYGYCFNSEIPRKRPSQPIANDLGCLRIRLPPTLTASH